MLAPNDMQTKWWKAFEELKHAQCMYACELQIVATMYKALDASAKLGDMIAVVEKMKLHVNNVDVPEAMKSLVVCF